MKKHIVKCPYCNKEFDTIQEEFVQLGRRYAHKSCFDNAGGASPYKKDSKPIKKKAAPAADSDLKELKEYINELYGNSANWAMITKQIKTFQKEYNYTYSGMLKTLKYFYEIKGGSKEKSNGTIGILPYIYQEAFQYYYGIYQAQQINSHKEIKKSIKNVTIKPPFVERIKKKYFKFLEEEDKNE